MRRTYIYLTEKQLTALRLIDRQRGVSMSAIIREAVDRYLLAYSRTEREQIMQAAFGIWADHTEIDPQRFRAEFDRSSKDKIGDLHAH